MKIDHIGYAVKRIDRAQKAFIDLGYTFEPIVDDTDRNIRISFGERDGYRIELVCPLDKGIESPVDAYLSKIGATPYHICYQTECMERDIENLKSNGYRVITEPAKAIAFNNKRVVFLFSLATGLIELVEI